MTDPMRRPDEYPFAGMSFEQILERAGQTTPEERARLAQEREDAEAWQRAQHRIEWAKRLSNLGPRFAERTLDTYWAPPGDVDALAIAVAVVRAPHKGAWFVGPAGLGKTHLAAGIVNALVAKGHPAAFLSTVTFVDRLRDSFDRNGSVREGKQDLIRAVAEVPVLVIDDLDKPKPTAWFCERMYRLVNERYERKLPAIVTTNVDASELKRAWGDPKEGGGERGSATIDRLMEMCFYFVEMTGESFRLAAPDYPANAICGVSECGHLYKAHGDERCKTCVDDEARHEFKPILKNGVIMTPQTEQALYDAQMEQKHRD